jgi:hypothetical protein
VEEPQGNRHKNCCLIVLSKKESRITKTNIKIDLLQMQRRTEINLSNWWAIFFCLITNLKLPVSVGTASEITAMK